MIKKLFFASLFSLLFSFGYATHFVGGNFAVCQTGANTFQITLRVYRDCDPSNSTIISPGSICVFDAVTGATVSGSGFSMTNNLISQQVLTLGDSCYTPSGICVEEYIFQKTISLNNNPNGYYLTWDDCCRNGIITNMSNPGSQGMTYYVQIPDPALWSTTTITGTNGNCTPDFGSYPTNGYLCMNYDQTIDFNVTDADGDSLSYSLVDPLNDNGCSPKPFPTCPWDAGYSLSNILGNSSNPNMAIDPVTGVITCHPENLGVFVFAVKVEEWRNGVKLGEVIRDLQYSSLACSIDSPPEITLADSVAVYVDDSICVDMYVFDADGTDTIYLNVVSNDFDLQGTYIPPTAVGNDFEYTNWMNGGTSLTFPHLDTLVVNGLSVFEGVGEIPMRYCWTPACEDLDSNYHVNLLAYSIGCSGSDTTEKQVVISVVHDPPPTILNVPDTLVLTLGDYTCIDLMAMDSINVTDTLFLQPYSGSFNFMETFIPPSINSNGDHYYDDFISPGNTFVMNNYSYSGFTPGAQGQVGLRFCWTTDCEAVFEKEYDLDYYAFSTACGSDTLTLSSFIEVEPPIGIIEPIPNIFSPNSDGVNDVYKLKGESDPCYDFMQVAIYNRWGQKVFESTDSEFEWDGTHKGKGNCKAGTYYVIIDGSYGSTYTNDPTPIRVPNLVKDEYYIQLVR